ncbi:MAG: BamA/OMP85 family outer membrane protein [Gemmatimonadaceae bacterium]
MTPRLFLRLPWNATRSWLEDSASDGGGRARSTGGGRRARGRLVRQGGLLCALAMPSGLAAAQAAAQKNDDRPLVRALVARGVSKVDRGALLDGLVTQPTKCRSFLYAPLCLISQSPTFASRRYLDPIELRRDVLRIRLFYWRRGYRDAVVTARMEPVGGGVRVVFDIDERDPTVVEKLLVKQIDSVVLPPAVVTSALQIREGEPLDLVAMDSTIVLLHNALWERGYADGAVQLDTSGVDNTRNAGPVTLVVETGARSTVHAVEIEGNSAVTDRTIRRLLRFGPGELYRRSTLLESQRELYLSGLFSEVDVAARPPDDSAKTVHFRLVEAPLHSFELTGGFTTTDFLQLDGVFTRYNFLGGARRLTLRGTISNLLAAQLNGSGPFYDVTSGARDEERDQFLRPTWSASIDFSQPWFLTTGNQLGASIFSHRRSVPGVVTDIGVGATVNLTRDLGPRTNATVGYTFEASRIEASDVYFCVSFGLCVPSTIDVIKDRHPLAPVAVVAQIDRTNDPFAPNQGIRARLDLEHASRFTASQYRYNRGTLTASQYFRTAKRSVLAARIRLGFVNALAGTNEALGVPGDTTVLVVHPRKLFFAGGSRSVRGYGENHLGPRVLTIDPAKLTGATGNGPCSAEQLVDGSCDPNHDAISAADFQPRPLGGSSVAEATLEFRFPLLVAHGFSGAVFVDGGIVGTHRFSDLLGATATITPGVGIRFDTRAGPVRLDLGVRPKVVETLPVITQVTRDDSTFQLVTLQTPRRYDPAKATGGALRQILSRLTLHLAIGPAF